ncbi:ParB/RepB/Spo0J family partition protein [Polymorphospora sp. NPDC050346]|uniref:ParB/RepB/Spo0J family partition protein n=1 Tax=Polymorphospora sp. NPDC050346 TaxID=3155780 RepID=UPI0033F8F9C5
MTHSVESPAADVGEDDEYVPPAPAEVVPVRAELVKLTSVVTHPANPRKEFTPADLADLEKTIRAQGVIQPPVVMPAARVAAAWPDHAADLTKDGVEWVVLVGARRYTASGNVYGDDPEPKISVVIREDAIADDPLAQLDAMTAENVARSPLTPLEEAESFATAIAAGRKQGQIAAINGCSQSHVSKRLKLRRLPQQLRDLVAAKELDITDALAYAEADDHDLMLAAHKVRGEQRWRKAADAVEVAKANLERQRRQEETAQRLAAEGVKVIESAQNTLGADYYQHEVRTERARTAATKAGTLVAEIGWGGNVRYFSTAKPKRTDNRTAEHQERLDRERAERQANKARGEACARLVAKAPKIPQTGAMPLLVDAAITMSGSDSPRLALQWLIAAGVIENTGQSPYQATQALVDQPWHVRAAAAYALSLANRETRLRTSWHTWNRQDREYLQLLVDQGGYTISEYEQGRLDAIAPTPEEDVDPPAQDVDEPPAGELEYRLLYDQVDSAWLLLTGDEPHSDHDGLLDEQIGEAQYWARQTLADAGVTVHGWITRAAGRGLEYVADLTGEC